jgi:ubiquitin carboxyl-terminal hydrolase 36/42
MSLVANQTPSPSQSQTQSEPKANGHLYDLLIHGKSGSKGANGTSSILKDMLASASQMAFSEPVGKNAFAIGNGVREIAPGPRSPKANGNSNGHASLPRVNGHTPKQRDDDEEEEEIEEPDSPSPSKAGPSTSKIIGPVIPTSTRKGKEPAPKERMLYEDPIDLSWPLPIRSRKQAAAGLYNPSMACYANATLQVLLHTPPVLR